MSDYGGSTVLWHSLLNLLLFFMRLFDEAMKKLHNFLAHSVTLCVQISSLCIVFFDDRTRIGDHFFFKDRV